ncbi:MAG: class I SAM-dependent methyltransferase [Acidimicrobiia bacterium]
MNGAGCAAAYSEAAPGWEAGPGQIYNRLAAVMVADSPVPLDGRVVLDLGAGTGAASRAVAAAGGRPLAVDTALGMLLAGRAARPPAVAADASALPFPPATFGAVVAAFSLNHLDDPAAGLREAARVTTRPGVVLASAYSADDDHPVKAAVEQALVESGWSCPSWYKRLYRDAIPRLSTVEGAAAAAAGIGDTTIVEHQVSFTDLGPADLVAWRMGMAPTAGFVALLDDGTRRTLQRRAVELLGDRRTELVRRFLVIATAL